MANDQILKKVEEIVKSKFEGEGSGHDWWHIQRVWKTAIYLAKKEGADLFVVQLAALLHDIADWKFHGYDPNVGSKAAGKILWSFKIDEVIVNQVGYIIDHISYKSGANKHVMKTIEGKVVQDADRLDAIGAIGIARVFAYGGYEGRPIFDPKIKPKTYTSITELKNRKRVHTSINHFYEKLLLLKDKMNTVTGKKLAEKRHAFLEEYLKHFYAEWNSKV
jgi:uncharacterized protein